ncbi:MAG: amino acid permease [Verrucomicrobiia bacterium]|jgi:amino acid transporter/nucleotide-binding universal stress UspA family protein
MEGFGLHRPRNVDWKRAAGLLYGDWGTSKAYVTGFAFSASAFALGYQSYPIILAVLALTAIVAYNYTIVCKHFPDGGGVYSAARNQSRILAVIGALLLVANFTVTAAMSCWAAMLYFGIPKEYVQIATMGFIVIIGTLNYFGPKHTGSVAMTFAILMASMVLLIIIFSVPFLTTKNLEPLKPGFTVNWLAFTSLILALSGVEAIANLTGVMKLDPGATYDKPCVSKTAKKAIFVVAIECVLGTAILALAMYSLPRDLEPLLRERWEDMLRVLAEQYGTKLFGALFGKIFSAVTGIVVGLLLLSAVNTAIGALIGLFYMLARDGEMPHSFTKLNKYGVPLFPLLIAFALPFVIAGISTNLESLMGLYAIGVVGAITVNLGSCSFNRKLSIKWYERIVMGLTFLIMFAIELTIAKTHQDALFFAVCVVGVGLGIRSYTQKLAGYRTLVVKEHIAAQLLPESVPDFKLNIGDGQAIMVAARGITPVLRFALEEARLRKAILYVLYVREISVTLLGTGNYYGPQKWQDDTDAVKIMTYMLNQGEKNEVKVVPLYAVSDNAPLTILDLAATLGIDMLILGASQRQALLKILRGNVIDEVAKNLPENIQLIIHG